MTLSDDEKWLLTENLKRQEREEIAKVEAGQDVSRGDFGSYYALLTGKDLGLAATHSIADPRYLASYARQLRGVVRAAGLERVAAVLDVGCGHGVLTRGLLAAFPAARIRGIDISESAIAYAAKTFPECAFAVVAVDESTDLRERFDVVHAREFYPFTRTADLDFHRKYLEVLARHVAPGGVLVLTLLPMEKCLVANLEALVPALDAAGMTPFERVTLANAKLHSFLPLFAARWATDLVWGLRGREAVQFFVSRRRPDAPRP